jgi:hypothetical protein
MVGILANILISPSSSAHWLPVVFDHDAIKRNRIMISSLCLSMIFSENRLPLFRIMLQGGCFRQLVSIATKSGRRQCGWRER